VFGIGMQELAVILVIALLVFGPKRLPELARSLGRGLAEFRRASSDLRNSFSESSQEPPGHAGQDPPGQVSKGPEAPEAASQAPTAEPAPAPKTTEQTGG
jgi:TatA/E family protein of Tat protein translocase